MAQFILNLNKSLNGDSKSDSLNIKNVNDEFNIDKEILKDEIVEKEYGYDYTSISTEEYLYNLYNEVQEIKEQNKISSEQSTTFKDLLTKIDLLTVRIDSLEHVYTQLKNNNDRLLRELLFEQAEKEEMKKQVLNLVALTTILRQEALGQEETKKQLSDLAVVTSTLKQEALAQTDFAQQTKTESQNMEISKNDAKLDIAIKQIDILEKLLESYDENHRNLSSRLTDFEYELQSFVRRHSLILENFCPREDSSAQDMFIVFVKNILKVNIEEADIEGLHVISKSEDVSSKTSVIPRDRPRPILITLTCYATKARIYRAWLAYRTSNETGMLSIQKGQGLTIREYLSETNEEAYREALQLRESGKILDVWTFKGKTFIKESVGGDIKEFVSKSERGAEKIGYSCLIM